LIEAVVKRLFFGVSFAGETPVIVQTLREMSPLYKKEHAG
jgi:hypothetical protein